MHCEHSPAKETEYMNLKCEGTQFEWKINEVKSEKKMREAN